MRKLFWLSFLVLCALLVIDVRRGSRPGAKFAPVQEPVIPPSQVVEESNSPSLRVERGSGGEVSGQQAIADILFPNRTAGEPISDNAIANFLAMREAMNNDLKGLRS